MPEKYSTEQTATILDMDASVVQILNILHETNVKNCKVAWREEYVFWIMYLTLYNIIFELIVTRGYGVLNFGLLWGRKWPITQCRKSLRGTILTWRHRVWDVFTRVEICQDIDA